MDTDTIQALGTTPCPGENPGGTDSRYEPEYEALAAEIEKLTSVTQTASCNWQVVADNGMALLSCKSKDFQVACYVAVALAMLRGLEGMVAGTAMLEGLVRNFWETGFPVPKRMRGRLNALEWWRERSTSHIQTLHQAEPFPAALVNKLAENVRNLDSVLGEVLPDFPPLRELLAHIGRLPIEAPPEATAPQEDTVPPLPTTAPPPPKAPEAVHSAQAEPVRSVAPHVSPAPAMTDDMQANRRAFASYVREFAVAAHTSDFADPLGWQAMRMALWSSMSSLPPSENGSTMIPGPEDANISILEGLRAAGKMNELAIAAEDMFPACPLWLDVQYCIAMALRSMGAEYAPALAVVEGECRTLIQRLPGLPRLRFGNDHPFADGATLQWLKDLVQAGNVAAPRSDTPHPAVADADKLYAQGQLREALDTLDKALAVAGHGPGRLTLRMAQTRLLKQAGQWPAAVALAEELTEMCTSTGLANWAPEQAAAALSLVRDVWNGLGGETGAAKSWEIGKMLARISPSAALKLA